MAHHSGKPFTEKPITLEDIAERVNMFEKLGPTGLFPKGKMDEHDEGEIKIAIGNKNGKVFMDFGKPIHWIGFTPDQAKGIALMLVRHAQNAFIVGSPKEADEAEGETKQ